MYQLKVNKQPKVVKATKAFKTNKYYSLYEAEQQYQEIFNINSEIKNMDDLTLDITISTNQKGKDGQNEYEMDIPVSNFDSLSELVSLEMQRYLSSVSDSEALVIQRDADVIAKEFLTPTFPTRSSQHEGQSLMTRLKNRHASSNDTKVQGKTKTEVESDSSQDQELKQKEEQVHQFLSESSNTEPLEPINQDEVKVEEASVPFPTKSEMDDQTEHTGIKIRKSKGASHQANKGMYPEYSMKQVQKSQSILTDEAEYIESLKEDGDVLQAKEEALKPLKDAISQGDDFVIQKMVLNPTDSKRMLELKKNYIQNNYNRDRLNQIQAQLDILIQDSTAESRQTLQKCYHEVLGDKGKEALNQAIKEKTEKLEAEYQQALNEDVNRLGDTQKVEKNRMEKRHVEEKNSLESRHKQELIDLSEKQTKEMDQLIKNRQYDFSQRKQDELDRLKEQSHEQWVEQTNKELDIERQTIKKSFISKIQMIGMQGNKTLKDFIASWQKNLQSQQDEFNKQEQHLIEEEEHARQLREQEAEKAEKQRLEEEAKAERDRQLQLEEDKLRLQQKQIEVEQQKNDKAIIEKETTIKELQIQLQEMKEDLKIAQEKLHEERIERIQDKSRFNETIELQQRNFEIEQQKAQFQPSEEKGKALSDKQKKHLITASIITVLGVGVAGMGWKSHQDALAEQTKQEALQKAQAQKQSDLEKSLKETQESLKSVKDENKKLSQKNKDLEEKDKKASSNKEK